MRRYLTRLLLLGALLLAVAVTVLALPSDPLAGGTFVTGDTSSPADTATGSNPYFIGTLKTSARCIEMLKDMEGYLQKPAGDYQQYSIGYGCNTKYLREYYEVLDMTEEDMEKVLSSAYSNYILKEEKAEALMMYVLVEVEEDLDEFLEKHAISLNQYQYDALVSFTYNLGTAWMGSTTRLGEVLLQGGYTVNELASAMGVYCHVTSGSEAKVLDLLVSRRIQEIKLFLYGAYELDDTDVKFCTLKYDAGDGTAETDIGFYQVGQPYQILFSAEPEENSGLYFTGWYTEDGQKLTAGSIVEGSTTVYAQYSPVWSDPQLSQDGNLYTPTDDPLVGENNYTGDSWIPVDVTLVFSDMKYEDWHYDYVCELYSRGVIGGYSDGTFQPGRTVTTGEALKMILLAAGYEEPERVASHWARNFLNLALDEGIIDRGEITDLDIPISRGLMAKIVVNSMKLPPLDDVPFFTDTQDSYVQTLYDYGISDGYTDQTFRPGRSLSRAELSAIVCRMYDVR